MSNLIRVVSLGFFGLVLSAFAWAIPDATEDVQWVSIDVSEFAVSAADVKSGLYLLKVRIRGGEGSAKAYQLANALEGVGLASAYFPDIAERMGNPVAAWADVPETRYRHVWKTDPYRPADPATLHLNPQVLDLHSVHPDSYRERAQRYLTLAFRSEETRSAATQRLSVDADVEYVADAGQTRLSVFPSDPLFSPVVGSDPIFSQWGLGFMNFPEAWDWSTGHAYVAVADGGIQLNHPDLKASFREHLSADVTYPLDIGSDPSVDEGGLEILDEFGQPTGEGIGHGTHVAGIIAASANNAKGVSGACWDCSLMIYKGIRDSDRSSSENGSGPAIPTALRRGSIEGAQIVNISAGAPPGATLVQNHLENGLCQAVGTDAGSFCETAKIAALRDVVIVAAAGNGSGSISNPSPDDEIDVPAFIPSVIGVGAVNFDGTLAPFSNTSDRQNLDFVAPGVHVLSTFYTGGTQSNDASCSDTLHSSVGYGPCSGTSMSAPMVSGAVALVRSVNPLLSSEDVYDILVSSAMPAADQPSGFSGTHGHGIPDAEAAVKLALGAVAGQTLENRLTPLFSFYSSVNEDSFYTTVPQMASAALYGDMKPLPPSASSSYLPAYGSQVGGYTNFPYDDPNDPMPTPLASVYLFTTDKNPVDPNVPLDTLYRLSFQGNYGGNRPDNLDHAYVTKASEIQAFRTVGYKLDGIEGYLFPNNMPQPEGTVALFRKYNPSRDDHAIFPESELATMTSLGYTVDEAGFDTVVGFVYPNTDSDADGLIDGFEALVGTCPDDPDTDGVGGTDGQEVLDYPYSNDPGVCSTQGGGGIPDNTPIAPWSTFSSGTLVTNVDWDYTMGYHFKPLKHGVVDRLGAYVNGTKLVRLWDKASGELLAETTITASNDWAFQTIPAVFVEAGREYTVAVVLEGTGGTYRDFISEPFPQTYGSVEVLGSTLIEGSTARPTNLVSTIMYGQVDIRFIPESAGTPLFTTVSADPSSIDDTQTSQLGVDAALINQSPLPPTQFFWSVVSGGGSLSNDTFVAPTYTPDDVSATTNVLIRAAVYDPVTEQVQTGQVQLTVTDAAPGQPPEILDLRAPGHHVYDLSMAYAPKSMSPAGTADVEIWFDGQLVTTLSSDTWGWSTHQFSVEASGPQAYLELRGAGASDGNGGYLDAITLQPAGTYEQANLVTNGSFETHPPLIGHWNDPNVLAWGSYTQIEGWTATQDRIELQTGEIAVRGYDGDIKAELDAVGNAIVTQTVTTESAVMDDTQSVVLSANVADADTAVTNLTYQWSATAGTFDDPTAQAPTFHAPDVAMETLVTLSLMVSDGANNVSKSFPMLVRDAPSDSGDTLSLTLSGDYSDAVYINGQLAGSNSDWQQGSQYSVPLQVGTNVIAVRADDYVWGGQSGGGVIADMSWSGGASVSDGTWLVSTQYEPGWQGPDYDDSAWVNATEYGAYGVGPWLNNVVGMPIGSSAQWVWSSDRFSDKVVYLRHYIQVSAVNTANVPPVINAVTAPGAHRYELSLAYSPRVSSPADTNDVEVWFDGQLQTMLSGTAQGWQTIVLDVNATGAASLLELKGAGTSDGIGGYVDDVQLVRRGVAEANRLINGSFETHPPLLNGSGKWGAFDMIDGWEATVEQIEVQNNQIAPVAADGDAKVEMDAAANAAIQQLADTSGVVLNDDETIALQADVTDADAGPSSLSYSWQTSAGSFDDPTAATPIYTPPDVTAETMVVITLTVSDGQASVNRTLDMTVLDAPAGS